MQPTLMEHDQAQRKLALDASQSFIVQAPAGSGKTELLIQRLLTLLAQVNAPEEILAITFTKKAANEMRARVIKALTHAMHQPEPTSLHDQKTWQLAQKVLQRDAAKQWNLIYNPNQLRIQTIDSFCASLTKQLPLLSHFGSQPEMADHPQALYREAVSEVMRHVEENDEWAQAIMRLLRHVDNDLNKLHDLLVNLLAKRDQWLSFLPLSVDDAAIKAQLERQLAMVITDHLALLENLFPREMLAEAIAIARFAAGNVKQQANPDPDILACLDHTTIPQDKRCWRGIAKLLLTKKMEWRKRVDADMGFPALNQFKNTSEKALHQSFRERLTQLVFHLHDNDALLSAMSELFYLPDASYNAQQWTILQDLLLVLKLVTAQLRLTFQQHGQIDFIENTQAALAALGAADNPTDLALVLDYQIRHVLMDEFQDTSFTQYQLLYQLTQGWETGDGRTLFVVGDPMQSIYRFREADVGLFIRLREHGIHHLALAPLTLSVNFRSQSPLVDWNNTHFAAIFPQFNDSGTGAVSYNPSVAQQQVSPEKNILIKGMVDASDEVEAAFLVDYIKQIQTQYPAESIAILVRSRPHLAAIIPALKKANLAYSALDIDPLASRPHIQDLLALTCALLHPADRIAWLSVLRAPWCGLALADLLVIAGDPDISIWQQMENPSIQHDMHSDGRRRLDKMVSILSTRMTLREREDLRTWVETTWCLLGGPATLKDVNDLEDANAYFELLAALGNQPDLDKLKERIQELYASTQHHTANLQIMTIHTAKGLEFDTVILPQLHKKNPVDDKALLAFMERPLNNQQSALLLAPLQGTGKEKDSLYEYIIRQQRLKSDYETDRLFYVATTRAKKRLCLLFNTVSKGNNEIRIESGSFLEKIWPQWEKYQNGILEMQLTPSSGQVTNLSRPIQRVQSDWHNPMLLTNKNNNAAHKNQQGFQLRDQTSKQIGIVTHHILQQLSDYGIQWWTQQTSSNQNLYVESRLRQSGVSANKLSFAVQSVLKAVYLTLNDERGKWILYSHHNAHSEYAITACINDKIENLVIDRWFVDKDNILWIIDYKTAELTHDDIENFLAKQLKKYQAKLQLYAEALKPLHPGSIRCGLYFPALPAWKEC